MKIVTLILLVFAFCVAGFASDVPWLAEVTTPPAGVASPDPSLSRSPAPALPLPPSPPRDLEEWRKQRAELRDQWLDLLGPLPQAPKDLHLATLREDQLDRCRRSLVRYEAEPGRFVEAYLLRPHAPAKDRLPAVVAFHPTNVHTIDVVGDTKGKPEQDLGLSLAERGYIVLCPKNFLWEEKSYDESVAAAKERHPKSVGMATMLADGMRAVDVLASLPDVDLDRIGTIGHSLGAKEVLYLMAFDERVKVGVASEGGVGLAFTNWDAPWYLGDVIHSKDFQHDHHELLALAAPRPLLIIAGESGPGAADGDRTWPYIHAGRQAYRLYGEPVRLGLLNHRQGHKLVGESREKALEWIDAALSEKSRARQEAT